VECHVVRVLASGTVGRVMACKSALEVSFGRELSRFPWRWKFVDRIEERRYVLDLGRRRGARPNEPVAISPCF
jgi:hypothetical protein